jgi:hypothetical protein
VYKRIDLQVTNDDLNSNTSCLQRVHHEYMDGIPTVHVDSYVYRDDSDKLSITGHEVQLYLAEIPNFFEY